MEYLFEKNNAKVLRVKEEDFEDTNVVLYLIKGFLNEETIYSITFRIDEAPELHTETNTTMSVGLVSAPVTDYIHRIGFGVRREYAYQSKGQLANNRRNSDFDSGYEEGDRVRIVLNNADKTLSFYVAKASAPNNFILQGEKAAFTNVSPQPEMDLSFAISTHVPIKISIE